MLFPSPKHFVNYTSMSAAQRYFQTNTVYAETGFPGGPNAISANESPYIDGCCQRPFDSRYFMCDRRACRSSGCLLSVRRVQYDCGALEDPTRIAKSIQAALHDVVDDRDCGEENWACDFTDTYSINGGIWRVSIGRLPQRPVMHRDQNGIRLSVCRCFMNPIFGEEWCEYSPDLTTHMLFREDFESFADHFVGWDQEWDANALPSEVVDDVADQIDFIRGAVSMRIVETLTNILPHE